jgi:hypothetical protein
MARERTAGETSPTSIVLPKGLKEEIQQAAKNNGRKPAAEIRSRLEASFAFDERAFGDATEKKMNRALANAVLVAADIIEVSYGHWGRSREAKTILEHALSTLVEKGVLTFEGQDLPEQGVDVDELKQGQLIGELTANQLDRDLSIHKTVGSEGDS